MFHNVESAHGKSYGNWIKNFILENMSYHLIW